VRRTWVLLAIVAVAGIVVGAIVVPRSTTVVGDADPARRGRATVERTDLIRTTEIDGTLGFGPADPLSNQRRGIVTWLPEPGEVVEVGHVIARIDEQPVVLLDGEIPAWRPLASGISDGVDILQLERTLADLGHFDGEPDDGWSAATTSAVRALQVAIEVDDTGRLDLGEAVFANGARRVADRLVVPGGIAQPGVPVIATTGATPVVTFDVDATDRAELAIGDTLSVELPGGRDVAATVERIAGVASVPRRPDGTAGDPVFSIRLALPADVEIDIEETPVTVSVVDDAVRDVLVVPVPALLALAEGGHAVEVIEADTTRLVRVELGVFVDGRVEVRGELTAGDEVVVPLR
jgi:hypothetical protein